MADPRGWLWREFKLELLEQDLLIFFRFGVARQNQCATVCSWQMNIDHLQVGALYTPKYSEISAIQGRIDEVGLVVGLPTGLLQKINQLPPPC